MGTILGVVGAGGLGSEIALSIRYFEFDKLATALLAASRARRDFTPSVAGGVAGGSSAGAFAAGAGAEALSGASGFTF